MNTSTSAVSTQFSGYQKVVVGMLAFLQFAVILDFMLMSPLGAVIMPSLSVTPAQFGTVVSAYAFAAGISGLLTAGFADRFDRKKLLLVFFWDSSSAPRCGLAQTSNPCSSRESSRDCSRRHRFGHPRHRTDLFPPQLPARDHIQPVPARLRHFHWHLSINQWNWHVPFLALVVLGVMADCSSPCT
jgi:hypothetical protein